MGMERIKELTYNRNRHNHEKTITKELSKIIYNHLLSRAAEESISIEKLYIRPEHVSDAGSKFS